MKIEIWQTKLAKTINGGEWLTLDTYHSEKNAMKSYRELVSKNPDIQFGVTHTIEEEVVCEPIGRSW